MRSLRCIRRLLPRTTQSSRLSSLPFLTGLPDEVKIVEVGPRDGLQNEAVPVSTENKIALIIKLAEAGCSFIEAGSFVSPKWVPSMADSKEVMEGLNEWRRDKDSSPVFSCLVPNLAGLQQAIEVKADEISIFGSASEAFSLKVSAWSERNLCLVHTCARDTCYMSFSCVGKLSVLTSRSLSSHGIICYLMVISYHIVSYRIVFTLHDASEH
jgi:hypothetical protein